MKKLAELQTGTLGGVDHVTDDMLDAYIEEMLHCDSLHVLGMD